MGRKAFFVLFAIGMLWAPPAFAAEIRAFTAVECAEFHKKSPGMPCVGTDADVAALALEGSPATFLEDHACKNVMLGCLDPQFTVLVMNFIKAGEEVGAQQGFKMPRVTDGWRSPADQMKAYLSHASKVGPCGSPHNYGVAVDFNEGNDERALQWMRANARNYGLQVIGNWDPAHFEIQGWSGSRAPRDRCITTCSAPPSGRVQSCTGGGAGGGGNTVMNSIGNALGNAFSKLTQPLNSMFNQQPAQPSQSNLPSINSGVQDVFNTTTPSTNNNTSININPQTTPANAPTSNTTPQTPEEILQEIAVGPKATNATTTPQHPLTDEELRLLREQQARLVGNTTVGGTLESPSGLQPLPVSPFAGFVPTEDLNQPASNEFISYYIQILTRVALAIGEILRIMGAAPHYDANNPPPMLE